MSRKAQDPDLCVSLDVPDDPPAGVFMLEPAWGHLSPELRNVITGRDFHAEDSRLAWFVMSWDDARDLAACGNTRHVGFVMSRDAALALADAIREHYEEADWDVRPITCTGCGHAVGSHWEVTEPDGARTGCGILGCPCQAASS